MVRLDTPNLRDEPWLGFAVVGFAIATNIATKAINFSLNEYSTPDLSVRAVMNVALGIVYAVCAVVAWRLLPTRLVGWLMVSVSLVWQAASWMRVLHDVGWLWPLAEALSTGWAILVGILVFCYPSGRLTQQTDRTIVAVASTLFAVRFAATLLFYSPSAAECACVPNAYAIWPDAALAEGIDNLWRLGGLLLIIVVAVRVSVRWVLSSPPARRVAFILPIALVCWALVSIYEVGGDLVGLPPLPGLLFLTPMTIAVIPLAFVAGMTHTRNLRSRVSDLVVIARDGVDRMVWQESLARTLDDKSLRVFWWDEATGGYLDSSGQSADPAADSDRRRRRGSLLEIDAGESPLAVINHDVGLAENTRLLDGVAAALRLSVDNERLRNRLENTLQDVRESRLRIVEAGDHARARLERDLHDGSQQQLVSIAINLRMISGRARANGDSALADDLDDVSARVSVALVELRALARGIHPTALTEGGLGTAVYELAARSAVPVDVDVRFLDRASPLVESTIYFVVAECLTNTARHSGAERASVRISADDDLLVFEIDDDGSGTADAAAGTGLRGLIDRVEALGGELRVWATPGDGTHIRGSLPIQLAAD